MTVRFDPVRSFSGLWRGGYVHGIHRGISIARHEKNHEQARKQLLIADRAARYTLTKALGEELQEISIPKFLPHAGDNTKADDPATGAGAPRA